MKEADYKTLSFFSELFFKCLRSDKNVTLSILWLSFTFKVESSDRTALNKLVETVKTNYNERAEEIKKHWGGSSLGNKSTAKINKAKKANEREVAAKA